MHKKSGNSIFADVDACIFIQHASKVAYFRPFSPTSAHFRAHRARCGFHKERAILNFGLAVTMQRFTAINTDYEHNYEKQLRNSNGNPDNLAIFPPIIKVKVNDQMYTERGRCFYGRAIAGGQILRSFCYTKLAIWCFVWKSMVYFSQLSSFFIFPQLQLTICCWFGSPERPPRIEQCRHRYITIARNIYFIFGNGWSAAAIWL